MRDCFDDKGRIFNESRFTKNAGKMSVAPRERTPARTIYRHYTLAKTQINIKGRGGGMFHALNNCTATKAENTSKRCGGFKKH
jgi:hypothetical protein